MAGIEFAAESGGSRTLSRALGGTEEDSEASRPGVPPYAKALQLLDSVLHRPLTDEQAIALAAGYASLAALDVALETANVPATVVGRIKGCEHSER